MKNIVSLLFMVCLLFISFSSCTWFMEVFGEEINEERIDIEDVYIALNPSKTEYKVGDMISIELTGILDFNKLDTYEFEVYFWEKGIWLEESSKKYEIINTTDGYYINSRSKIRFVLKESDCNDLKKIEDKDHCYVLFKQINVRFLKSTDVYSAFSVDVNCQQIPSAGFIVLQ